jgi:hypothetical protein
VGHAFFPQELAIVRDSREAEQKEDQERQKVCNIITFHGNHVGVINTGVGIEGLMTLVCHCGDK